MHPDCASVRQHITDKERQRETRTICVHTVSCETPGAVHAAKQLGWIAGSSLIQVSDMQIVVQKKTNSQRVPVVEYGN